MTQRIPAIYQDGAFVPQVACDFPENAQVNLTVDDGPEVLPPQAEPRDRAEIKRRLLERLRSATLSEDAPKLTRDELHDRA